MTSATVPNENKDEPAKVSRVIFVDDDQILLDSFAFAFGRLHHVDIYADPQLFLDSLDNIEKNTQIVLDFNFDNFPENGIDIAKRLHLLNFTKIVVISGTDLTAVAIPDFVTVIPKTDVISLGMLLAKNKVR